MTSINIFAFLTNLFPISLSLTGLFIFSGPSDLTFVMSHKGGRVLQHKGFQYSVHSYYREKNSSYWNCYFRNRFNCKGRAILYEHENLKKLSLKGRHNHPPFLDQYFEEEESLLML